MDLASKSFLKSSKVVFGVPIRSEHCEELELSFVGVDVCSPPFILGFIGDILLLELTRDSAKASSLVLGIAAPLFEVFFLFCKVQ